MNGLLAAVIICVCLILDTHDVKGEVFTALAHMKQVLEAEQSIAYDLNKYIAKEEERLGKLKTWVKIYNKLFCLFLQIRLYIHLKITPWNIWAQ